MAAELGESERSIVAVVGDQLTIDINVSHIMNIFVVGILMMAIIMVYFVRFFTTKSFLPEEFHSFEHFIVHLISLSIKIQLF